jgi:hypothetical protein
MGATPEAMLRAQTQMGVAQLPYQAVTPADLLRLQAQMGIAQLPWTMGATPEAMLRAQTQMGVAQMPWTMGMTPDQIARLQTQRDIAAIRAEAIQPRETPEQRAQRETVNRLLAPILKMSPNEIERMFPGTTRQPFWLGLLNPANWIAEETVDWPKVMKGLRQVAEGTSASRARQLLDQAQGK